MTTRKKIFIFSGLITGLIIVIILLFIFLGNSKNNNQQGEVSTGSSQNSNFPAGAVNGNAYQDQGTGILYNTNVNLLADGIPKQDITEQYLRQLASIFVERFNSYSNQNDNTHIEDALEMSTEKMGRWISTQKVFQSSEYEGVVTKVFSAQLDKLYDTRAVIKVQAKITKKVRGSEEVEYKTGFVDLLEEVEGTWLVDRFVWAE